MIEIVKLRDGHPSLNDIPNRLRLLADNIEAGSEGDVDGVFVLIPRSGAYPSVFAFGHVEGPNDPIIQLSLAKHWLVANLVVRE